MVYDPYEEGVRVAGLRSSYKGTALPSCKLWEICNSIKSKISLQSSTRH